MEYALLIYSREEDLPEQMEEAEREAFYADFGKFNRELEAAGGRVAARRLQTVDTATTQRVREGRVLTTDGPFAETKECLAGFYVIEAEDLDTALA